MDKQDIQIVFSFCAFNSEYYSQGSLTQHFSLGVNVLHVSFVKSERLMKKHICFVHSFTIFSL